MPRSTDRARPAGGLASGAGGALAGCLAALLTRAPHLRDASLFDIDVYLTMGQQWWNGAVPSPRPVRPEGPVPLRVVRAAQRRAPEHDPGRQDRVCGRVPRLGRPDVSARAEAPRRPRGPGARRSPTRSRRRPPSRSRGPNPNADQWALIGLVACVDLADRRRCGGSLAWAAAAGGVLALLVAVKPHHAVMLPGRGVLLALRTRRGACARSCSPPAASPSWAARRWSRSPSGAAWANCASSSSSTTGSSSGWPSTS